MVAVVTPDGAIEVPEGTPEAVVRAVSTASETRFCHFTGNLISIFEDSEFAIEAIIGPERTVFRGSTPRSYRVRFLIPQRFPYRTAHAVPVDPDLKWYPHQNGDWPGLNHANVICPPRHSEIHLEELLLPHIRHTYRWITDALEGNLAPPDERYELPHIIKRSSRRTKVYAEGGRRAYEWLRIAGCGRARLSQLVDSGFSDGLFRVVELQRGGGTGPSSLRSELRNGVFGKEEEAGWAPWVFAGNPVAESPHRPATTWADLSDRTQLRIMEAIRIVSRRDPHVPILLLAFGVPELWGGTSENIVWEAIYLEGFGADVFATAREHPRRFDIRKLQPVTEFIEHNRRLGWIPCTDVSRAALGRRSRAGTQSDLGSTRIALLGVGAVGSVLASAFAKLDPMGLILIDKESIEPGNLVRHEALAFQVEQNKASSISVLHPTLRVVTLGYSSDVVNDWHEVAGYLADCDLVVDATGDAGVNELLSTRPELADKIVAWCYVKPGPDFGVIVLRQPGSLLTLAEAESHLQEVVDAEVWAQFEGQLSDPNRLVWPEPGCYYPTFDAPYHRMRMMSDSFLTTILSYIGAREVGNVATLFCQYVPNGRLGLENRIEAQIRIW